MGYTRARKYAVCRSEILFLGFTGNSISIFKVRLHVMQRTVLLSQFCLSVCLSDACIELFRYLLRLRRYEWKSVEVGVFRRGWVALSEDFRGKGASPTNHCWCQKTRVIAVSCGIKMFAVRHLVLSQYTRVTDRRTDGQTDRITTRICSRGKNEIIPFNYEH